MIRRVMYGSVVWVLVVAFSAVGEEAVRVACIGDSITYGSGIENRDKNSYPAQMQVLLGDAYEVRNFGVGGATMLKESDRPYWETDAFEPAKTFAPDVVVIQLGTNDSKPHWDADAYERDYRTMVDVFQSLPSRPTILVCRPVPAFTDNYSIRNEVILREVIPIVDRVGTERRLWVLDLYNEMLDDGGTFPDGIHPDAEGAGIMANFIAAALKDVRPAPVE